VRPMPACTTAIVLVPAEAACAIAGCVPTAAADRSLGGEAGGGANCNQPVRQAESYRGLFIAG